MSLRLSRALGFDLALEQSAVRPENVNFGLGKTPRLALWAGGYCRNGIFTYGDRPEVLWESVRRAARLASTQFTTRMTAKQSDRRPKPRYQESGFRESGEAAFYDLPGLFAAKGIRLERNFRGFSYRRPESLLHFLTDLQEFRLRVQDHYAKTPYGAVHRKLTLIFLHLDEASLAILRGNEKAMRLLQDIFLNGHRERLALLLVTQEASSIPENLYRQSDVSWFQGEANSAFAENRYKLPVYRKHFGLVHIGLLWDKTMPDTLRSFCFVESEKSEWLQEKKSVLREQDEDWKNYLKSLEAERV